MFGDGRGRLGLCPDAPHGWACGRGLWGRSLGGNRGRDQVEDQNEMNINIMEIVSAVLAFLGAFALTGAIRNRRAVKRMEAMKAALIKTRQEEIEAAAAEKERIIKGAELLEEEIEGASMGELAELINSTFKGDPDD